MSLRSTHLKLVGAAGAAALTVGAIASPALAAGELSATVNYSCLALNAIEVTPTAEYAVAAPPATLVAGQQKKLATTSTFELNPTDTALAGSSVALDADTISGTITTAPSNAGVGLDLTFPKTPLGNNVDGSTTAHASGDAILKFTKAGTFKLKLGNIGKVHLQGWKSGNKSKTANFPDASAGNGRCKNVDGTTTLQDSTPADASVTVVKDSSKTTTTATYVATKDVAKGKAKVRGATYGLPGTGTVKFILKKGTHKIDTLKGKLNKKGIASVSFKNVKKKGKYSITAKFGGDAALKASSGKDTFTV